MSLIKANNVQIGQSAVAANNFVWYQPSTPDGTVRLGIGNAGSVTDLLTASSATSTISITGTINATNIKNTVLIGTRENRVAMPANNIDLSTGSYFTKTISGATTLTVSNAPPASTTASIILELINGGSAAITWWGGMTWADGKAPTLTASGLDILGFYTHDGGTTWRGLLLGKNVKAV